MSSEKSKAKVACDWEGIKKKQSSDNLKDKKYYNNLFFESVKNWENPYPEENFKGEYFNGFRDAYQHFRKLVIDNYKDEEGEL